MWRLVFAREWLEYRRRRRMAVLVIASAGLLAAGLGSATSQVREGRRRARVSDAADRAAFAAQGAKNPHAAAHFGRMAYRPPAPFGVFDPGATAYLGRAIWLEAHVRSPAMLRPAEDAPELSRLADLSVAGLLAALIPLVVSLLGAPIFAAERSRGTLRQTLATGVSLTSIFGGKLVALWTAGKGMAAFVILGASLVVLSFGQDAMDLTLRSSALILAYGLYALGWAAVAIGVSIRARSVASAQLVLLSFWAASLVVVPRVAGTAAAQIAPSPHSEQFWSNAAEVTASAMPARDSNAYRRAAREVAARAVPSLGGETATSALNGAALRLEVSEVFSREIYGDLYRELFSTYRRQRAIRRWFSFISPVIALRQFSSAACGTDTAAHRHFSEAAERARTQAVEGMNRDMLVNGAGQGFGYIASPELWGEIPTFDYHPPGAVDAVRGGAADLLALGLWSTAACLVAWFMARRSIHGGLS